VPRFNRLSLHPQVNDIIGEFASFTLLEVDNSRRESFEVRAKRLTQQLWHDLEHQYVSGVRVLRELTQLQGRTSAAPMPVVFTTNPQNNPGQSDSSILSAIAEIGEVVYVVGQTPQVWIDNLYSEAGGTLFLNWDAVEELFPQGLIDDMFDAYCRLLQRLALEEEAWQEEAQVQQQAIANGIEAPIPDVLLHELFAMACSQAIAASSRDRARSHPHLRGTISAIESSRSPIAEAGSSPQPVGCRRHGKRMGANRRCAGHSRIRGSLFARRCGAAKRTAVVFAGKWRS
jgi:non-ribosomal peptide synthetase component F